MKFLIVSSLILLSNYLMTDAASSSTSDTITDLSPYRQPDFVGRDPRYDDLSQNSGCLCARDCCKYPEPKICYWEFYIEQYQTMGPACLNCTSGNTSDCYLPECIVADGRERVTKVVNRMLPGPGINVCYGDRIIVDVKNGLLDEATTIHWHGMLQRKAPWMDGVPFVSQCPILDGETFRYDFIADTYGTHFWHSHLGYQFEDGVYGPLNIRTCGLPKGYCSYDFDLVAHNILINDWFEMEATEYFPGYWQRPTNYVGDFPLTCIINGMGRYTGNRTAQTYTPVAKFYVNSGGGKYLFRLVSVGASSCPTLFTIEDHYLTICALDGYGIVPVTVKSIYIASGMRVDFTITTFEQNPNRTYNIIVQNQDQCIGFTAPCNALLIYDANEIPPSTYDATTAFSAPYLGNVNLGCHSEAGNQSKPVVNYCTTDLRGLENVDPRLTCGKPDYTFIMASSAYLYTYDNNFRNRNQYPAYEIPQGGTANFLGVYADTFWNNISFSFPYCSMLTDQTCVPRLIADGTLCRGNCNESVCSCTNTPRVESNKTVLVCIQGSIVAENHPFHLHGHYFSVVYQATQAEIAAAGGFDASWLNHDCGIPNPAVRDTEFTPSNGVVCMKWITDNPGMWIHHCHFEQHLEGGMSVVWDEGNWSDLPIPPNMPTCGPYTPPVAGTSNFAPGSTQCASANSTGPYNTNRNGNQANPKTGQFTNIAVNPINGTSATGKQPTTFPRGKTYPTSTPTTRTATAGESPSGTATTGAPPSGTATTGGSPSGTATTGRSPSGPATTGRSPSGPATTGAPPSGTATTGRSPSGTVTTGKSPSGPVTTGTKTSGTATTGGSPSGTVTTGRSPSGPVTTGTKTSGTDTTETSATAQYPSADQPTKSYKTVNSKYSNKLTRPFADFKFKKPLMESGQTFISVRSLIITLAIMTFMYSFSKVNEPKKLINNKYYRHSAVETTLKAILKREFRKTILIECPKRMRKCIFHSRCYLEKEPEHDDEEDDRE